jgi:hypothetical protein
MATRCVDVMCAFDTQQHSLLDQTKRNGRNFVMKCILFLSRGEYEMLIAEVPIACFLYK